MPLYCKQVYWPENVQLPSGAFMPQYSRHALDAAEDDRYGRINLPAAIYYQDYEIFEMLVENGKVKKIAIRGYYDERRNLVIVVNPDNCRVITVWTNLHSDTHATLDHSRYDKE